MGNEVVQKRVGIAGYLLNDTVKKNVTNTVGIKNADRFISSVVSAVQTNPVLSQCTNSSILSAALLGESLKLSPSPQLGQYYMVPYGNKKTGQSEAQFQMGYKGYIQLALRSGYYKKMNVTSIKEGELIKFDRLNEEIEIKQITDEIEWENAKTIGYYAMFEYLNGFRKAIYWSKEKMLLHADRYSQAFSKDAKKKKVGGEWKELVSFEDYEKGNYPKGDEWLYSSFWYKDFDGMAYKTMLRNLISKWGIMSIELQSAFENDMAVLENGKPKYVDSTAVKEEIIDPFEKNEETIEETEQITEKKKSSRVAKNEAGKEEVKPEK